MLRQVTHVSLGGGQIRVQFSNLVGNGPVTIKSAHVALCKAAPVVDSSIDAATDKALAFSGMPGVTIAARARRSGPTRSTSACPALGNVYDHDRLRQRAQRAHGARWLENQFLHASWQHRRQRGQHGFRARTTCTGTSSPAST